MAQITYADKSTMNENSSIPATNKCQASDMNEIKSVVNENYNEVGDITTLTTTDKSSVVNAINEVNGLKGKIIWTNSNPTNNFTAQTITVPNLSNYDMIGVFFFRNTNKDAIFEIKCYNHKNYASTVGGWYGGGSFSFYEEGTKYVQSRTFWITSQTTIQFNAGYINSSIDNGRAIPLYIVGYKNSITS